MQAYQQSNAVRVWWISLLAAKMSKPYIALHPLFPTFWLPLLFLSPLVPVLQVGEFYETMGTDAVMLVQHAGLNPMGQGDPPRAGCPVVNLRRTISDLVEQAGLSVVSSTPPICKCFCMVHRTRQMYMLMS